MDVTHLPAMSCMIVLRCVGVEAGGGLYVDILALISLQAFLASRSDDRERRRNCGGE
jgi:hypothetical protein